MTRHKILAGAFVASGLLALAHGGAEAAIQCDGNFQLVNGQPVGTLYCREMNLARVARSYGWHVSDHAIRYSEATKAQVCRLIGYDRRVQQVCAPYRTDGGDSFSPQ
jgi:hypothetical protein